MQVFIQGCKVHVPDGLGNPSALIFTNGDLAALLTNGPPKCFLKHSTVGVVTMKKGW